MKFKSKIHLFALLIAMLISLLPGTPSANASGNAGLTMYVRVEYTDTPNTLIEEFYSGDCWHGAISNINFQWGDGGQVLCPSDYFTDYIFGYLKAPSTGTIYFFNLSDDGFYLKLNETLVINDWEEQGVGDPNGQGSFYMTEGSIYSIKIWHHETGGGAWNQLFWSTTNDFSKSVLIPQANLATDPTYWGSTSCTFKGNSALAKNTIGQSKSNSLNATNSKGAGACQNASNR